MDETIKSGDIIVISKLGYGARIPTRPLCIPFTHNTIPFTNTKSYSDLIRIPYLRSHVFRRIKRNDVVSFNFPEGDTVITSFKSHSYYNLQRKFGGKFINSHYQKIYRPVDRREYYVKRCIAIPGDIIYIKNGDTYVKYDTCFNNEHLKYKYFVKTDSGKINKKILRKNGVSSIDFDNYDKMNSLYELPLTKAQANSLKMNQHVIGMMKFENTNIGLEIDNIFPHDKNYKWTEDNFGPVYVPAKGQTIKLDIYNLPLYQRIISVYEQNKLQIEGNKIYINDSVVSSYTFKMDYYFMLGDNRHYSDDSRYWGFVPEDHIEGRALCVLFSFDKNGTFLHHFKWTRIFKIIK